MNYKLQKAFKKGKTTIIVSVILWLLLAVIVIMQVLGKDSVEKRLKLFK